jgi:RNA polymerase sigma-70 factor, ECF subfamily
MEQQFTQIWQQFHAPLRNFISKSVPSEADADDILQELFIKLMRHPDKWTTHQLKSHLYMAAKNAVIDFHRLKKNKAYITDNEIFIQEKNDKMSESVFVEHCFLPILNLLPPKYREALLETEINGLSQLQYAEKTGISYTAAKSRVQRAKAYLRDMILTCCPQDLVRDRLGNVIAYKGQFGKSCLLPSVFASYLKAIRYSSDNFII